MKTTYKKMIAIVAALIVILGLGFFFTHQQHTEAADNGTGRTTITFWHSMNGPNEQVLENLVNQFNKSQTKYTIKPIYVGSYELSIVRATEARPTEAKQLIDGGKFDLIVYTSPLPKAEYGVPVINGTGLLTGIGEDEFWDELKKTVAKITDGNK
ncbi:hypothetical protein D0638_14750 [Lacticaseibacillus paracasei]|nr:hypothetical protein D0638_14750 [Lacticaseibacillus paracasei]